MIYLNAFLFAGIVCLIGELIYLFTKLTPGHITTLFVIAGAFLAGIGIYDLLIKYFGGGATCLITNFGYLLVKGGLEGVYYEGIIGLFKNLFLYCSGTLTFVIFISILSSFIPKVNKK